MHNATVPESRVRSSGTSLTALALVLLAIGGALSLALLASRESLWLDELHTSWVLSGPVNSTQVAPFEGVPGEESRSAVSMAERAHQGNQTLAYFALLRGLTRTLGHHEWVLRLPSVLAWIWVICLCFWSWVSRERAAVSLVAVGFGLCCLVLDRTQLFYASEARVYGILQAVSLIGWFVTGRLLGSVAEHQKMPFALVVVWATNAAACLYLHVTGLLPVLCQWFAVVVGIIANVWTTPGFFSKHGLSPSHVPPRGSCLSLRESGIDQRLLRGRRLVRLCLGWCAVLGLMLLCSLPSFALVHSVWQRRQQWSSFAGDASVGQLISLFPWLPLLLPATLAIAYEYWIVKRYGVVNRNATFKATFYDACRLPTAWLWLWAAMAPVLIGWFATAFGVAPLMHSRFLISTAVPLILFATWLVGCIDGSRLRFIVACVSLLWLLASQGTLANWRRGEVVGWLRSEGWRQTAAHLQQVADERAGADIEVWCASGLIEGRTAELPLSSRADEYLSFPLRGLYGKGLEPMQVHALVANWRLWPEQWQQASVARRRVWIVYRGMPLTLEQLLRELTRSGKLEPSGAIRTFGLVSVVEVELSPRD